MPRRKIRAGTPASVHTDSSPAPQVIARPITVLATATRNNSAPHPGNGV